MRIIDVSGRHGEPDPEAMVLFRQCLRDAVETVAPDEPTAPRGVELLRIALANQLDCAPDQLAITCGVRAAVPLLAPFLPYLTVETPSFEDLPALARSLGCVVERAPWPELTLDDSRAIWLTHPCRNPDGASLPPELLERLPRRRNLAVVNEVYRWHSPTGRIPVAGNVVAVGSLAKIWGPAARLGWVRGNLVAELSTAALRISSPPPLVQHAWAAFIDRHGLDLLGRDVEAADAARRRFCDLIDPEQLAVQGDGPSVLVRLPAGISADEALQRLLRLGVKATAGRHFGVPYESLRLTFIGVPLSDAEVVARAYRSLFNSPNTAR